MWFKVDDNFLNHDKLLEFDGDPVRWSRNISVWLACGLCCSQNQSDGLLRASRVRRLCAPGVDVDSALDDLRAVGLVDVIDGDDWVHDFLEYNPSREQQDEKKRKHAETQKKYRDNARKREKSRKAARDISRNSHSDITQQVTQPRGDNGRDTPPYRSVPIRTVPNPDPPVVPQGDDTKSERKGRTMRKDPAADFLAKTVTIQLNAHLGKRFDGYSKCARKAARRWRGEGWTEVEIVEALKIRIAKLNAVGNTENQLPETLYNTKLADYVAMVKNGTTAKGMEPQSTAPMSMGEKLRKYAKDNGIDVT